MCLAIMVIVISINNNDKQRKNIKNNINNNKSMPHQRNDGDWLMFGSFDRLASVFVRWEFSVLHKAKPHPRAKPEF